MSSKEKIKIDIEETLVHGSILLPLFKHLNINNIYDFFFKEELKHSTLYHSYVQEYFIEINIPKLTSQETNFYEMLTYYGPTNNDKNSLSSLLMISDSNHIMSSSFLELQNRYLEKNIFKYNIYEYNTIEQIDVIFENGSVLAYPDKNSAPGACSFKLSEVLQLLLTIEDKI